VKRKSREQAIAEEWLSASKYTHAQEILEALELRGRNVPSRSTVYKWVGDWRAAHSSSDAVVPWSLATDRTGRPDIVMRVIAALDDATDGRRTFTVSLAQANWLVKLAAALPDDWAERQGIGADGEDVPGAVRLFYWADVYLVEGGGPGTRLNDYLFAREWWGHTTSRTT
jgi:hypothetical protein